MSETGSVEDIAVEIVPGVFYELACSSGERLFALASHVDRARGTVVQLVLAVRLAEGLWARSIHRAEVSLEIMEQEARAAREGRA